MNPQQQRVQTLRNRLNHQRGKHDHGRHGRGRPGPGNNQPPGQPLPPDQTTTPQPGATQLPWDAQYETTVGNLRNDYNQTLANLRGQQNAVVQDYGFQDTSNPYSKASALQTAYQQGQSSTLNNFASHGQLYAGSTSNALAAGREKYNQSFDSLERDYQSRLADLTGQRTSARNDYATGLQNAEAARLEAALNARPDPSTVPGPDTPPPDKHDGGGKKGGGGDGKHRGGGGHRGGKGPSPGNRARIDHVQQLLKQARRHDQNKRARRLRRRMHNLR